MKHRIAVAISGGIDSLVSAYLLKNQGHDISGIHFLTGYETGLPQTAPQYTEQERLDLTHKKLSPLADQLKIPIHIIDCTAAFNRRVVAYFIRTYQSGRTPNPCMVCNPEIKFGVILEKTRQMGIDHLATGHYARITRDSDDRWHLLKGVDAAKDQSYFLARLTQHQLQRACFPLGDWTKADTVAFAAAKGLAPLTSNESQDVCFIQGARYADFVSKVGGFQSSPGPIVDLQGRRLGTHTGLHRFTVGQRRGINCPGPEPYYVIRLETKANRLVVGPRRALWGRRCRVEAINWIHDPPPGSRRVDTRVRYRHAAAPAMLEPLSSDTATIHFDTPQSALTPGQGAVFYHGQEVLGAGWIQGDL